MFTFIFEDIRRLYRYRKGNLLLFLIETIFTDNGFHAVFLYRVASTLKRLKVPLIPFVIAKFSQFFTGVDISPKAKIGPGFVISHGNGVVIGGYAQLGRNVTLNHQVTIGAPTPKRITEMPIIEDNVFIGAGSIIVGKVRIGRESFIGAGVIVTSDIPPNSKVVTQQKIEIKTKNVV